MINKKVIWMQSCKAFPYMKEVKLKICDGCVICQQWVFAQLWLAAAYVWPMSLETVLNRYQLLVTNTSMDAIKKKMEKLSNETSEAEVRMTSVPKCFLSDPGFPGPIYGSGCHWLTETPCWDLTDVTLSDEDTDSILTDNANRTIQGNVAMQVTQTGGQIWN